MKRTRTIRSFFSPAPTPVTEPKQPSVEPSSQLLDVEQQAEPETENVVQPEIVASRASNVDAGNVVQPEIVASRAECSINPYVVLNEDDDDTVTDPGLYTPIEKMHPNIRSCQKRIYFERSMPTKRSQVFQKKDIQS